MKKVLIISQHGWPPKINAQILRLANLVKHLPKYGWEPIVVARETKKYEFQDAKYSKRVQGIKVYRYHGLVPWNNRLNMFFRWFFIADVFLPDLMLNFGKILKIIKKERPDVILVSTPPSGFIIGYLLSEKTNIPLVIDYADPWITHKESYNIENKTFKKIERDIAAHSKKIFVASPAHLNEISRYIKSKDKILWLPNGFDTKNFEKIKNKKNDKVVFLYGGSLYSDFDISFLEIFSDNLEYFSSMPFSFELRFVGPISDAKYEYIKERGKGFVKILGQMPKDEFLREIGEATILIFSRGEKYDDFMSSTMTEYIRTGKPIMAFVKKNSLAEDIFKNSGTSFIFRYGEKQRPKEFIIKAIEGKIKVEPKMDYIIKFEWENIAKKLADALEEASGE